MQLQEVKRPRPTALVTGASSGIGEQFARQLVGRGYDVVIVARRQERLQKLKEELERGSGASVHILAYDISLRAECEKMLEAALKLGPIHGLVNNAGIGHYGPFLETSEKDQMQMVDLNVATVALLSHRLGRHMLEHKEPSWILNVASVAAFQGIENFAVYCASKAFVRTLSETMHREYRGTNLVVTCVSPGGTQSEFIEKSGQTLKGSGAKMMMTAEAVVADALWALDRKLAQKVPGWMNACFSLVPRMLPYQTCLRLFSWAMQTSVERKARG